MKIDENKGALQKKRNPALKPAKSGKKAYRKSPTALSRPQKETALRSMKRDLDFLKLVEEKKKTWWVHADQVAPPPEFSLRTWSKDFFTIPESAAAHSGKMDVSQPSNRIPNGSNYLDGGARTEILRRLESKREQLLREIFMGLRFSFSPAGRHLVVEMNVTPSSEKGPGLNIPF